MRAMFVASHFDEARLDDLCQIIGVDPQRLARMSFKAHHQIDGLECEFGQRVFFFHATGPVSGLKSDSERRGFGRWCGSR